MTQQHQRIAHMLGRTPTANEWAAWDAFIRDAITHRQRNRTLVDAALRQYRAADLAEAHRTLDALVRAQRGSAAWDPGRTGE